MHRLIGTFTLSMLLVGLSGCSYLFYPRAGDYTMQAKGASGVETMINLTNMMETTASKAKGGGKASTAPSMTCTTSSMRSMMRSAV